MSSTIIAIYPGRFQPMGAHHKATYDWAVSTFGYDNTFITSSNKVEPIKSPLSYQEKKMIAVAHGVPENKFVLSRSPYRPIEVFQTLQDFRGMFPQDFSVVFVVGKKDMEEDPRFRPGYKKSGAPSYFQYYNPSIELASADTHGYLVVAPHMCILLPNGKECSGTNLREYLGAASSEEFSTIMGFYDDVIYNMVRRKFSVQPINSLYESEIHRDDLTLGTEEYGKYIDGLIDDIHHVKKSLKTRSKKGSKHRKEAARLQNAIDSLKYMNRKNQRQLTDNNRIDERLMNLAVPEEEIVKKCSPDQETNLTRDEIKSYFYRLKNK